jgi:hypothetical protein
VPAPSGHADRGRPEPDYPYGGRGSSEVRRAGHRRGEAGYPDPDYSALAVSEPAADFTSTQTWEVVDDGATGSWGAPPADTPSGRLAPPADRRFGDSGRHGHGLPANDLQDSGIWDSGLQDVTTDSGPLRDSGGHSRGPRTTAPPDGGLSERVTRPRVPPAAAAPGTAPGTQRSGHRRAPEEPPPPGLETGRTASEATGRMANASAGRPPQAGGSRHGTRGRPRPKRRGGRTRLLVAGGAVVAVIGIAAAYLMFSGSSGNHSNGTTAGPIDSKPKASVAQPGPPASLGTWGYIGSRTTDPVPLSLTELFPSTFPANGLTYTMTVDKSRTSCSQALVGSSIQSAAQSAGCNQAMSASYLSSDQKLMGTIGVLNLSTAAGSESTGKAAGASETIAQLPGPSGPTTKLTQGTGIEAAEVKGHYLVLVWAEFANLQAPSTAAEKQQLQDFINTLIQNTANISLASREVTGKPAS